MRNVIASKTRIGCSVRRDILGGSSSCNLPNASNNAAPFDCQQTNEWDSRNAYKSATCRARNRFAPQV
jgi:hypothetical protein